MARFVDQEQIRKMGKMKKVLAIGAFVSIALSGCGGGGATQAVPTITHTVTQTATATVTATVTATPAASIAAAPAAVVPPAPAQAATATIPAVVAGMNAEALDDELTALGFKKVVYNADTGKTVILLRNWTVTGIDNAGADQATDKAVVVHVTK